MYSYKNFKNYSLQLMKNELVNYSLQERYQITKICEKHESF